MSRPWRRTPRDDVVNNAEAASTADVAFNMTRNHRVVAESRLVPNHADQRWGKETTRGKDWVKVLKKNVEVQDEEGVSC